LAKYSHLFPYIAGKLSMKNDGFSIVMFAYQRVTNENLSHDILMKSQFLSAVVLAKSPLNPLKITMFVGEITTINCINVVAYHLVMTNIAMENHHV
jgi:hypothetical protein